MDIPYNCEKCGKEFSFNPEADRHKMDRIGMITKDNKARCYECSSITVELRSNK